MSGLAIANFSGAGIVIDDVSNVRVTSMYIGTEDGTAATGTSDGNLGEGIRIQQGAADNVISGNLISGNGSDGVRIIGPGGAAPTTTPQSNVVTDNWIGIDREGAAAIPNGGNGVLDSGQPDK